MADSSIKYSPSSDLIASNRLFSILSDQVKDAEFYDVNFYKTLTHYLDKYISYHELDAKSVAKFYLSYIKDYNKDARLFDETGKYPLELNPERGEPSRTAYSIILLLSTLLTAHRFRIMQLIKDKTPSCESGLFIGCGPGLEIELVKASIKNLHAFDLTIDPFLSENFQSEVLFKNEYFDGSGSERYNQIYLIELLEHLDDPYELLKNCKKVLSSGGQLFLTTATNIPQFDHLYHFPSDHKAFDQKVDELGFKVLYSEEIIHAYMTKSLGSMNKFYILTH